MASSVTRDESLWQPHKSKKRGYNSDDSWMDELSTRRQCDTKVMGWIINTFLTKTSNYRSLIRYP